MADIFISYASQDRERVKPLAKALEERGWSVWWDRDLPFGRPFDEVIRTELRTAGCVVALWTESATSSLYVIGEARDALRQKKLVSVLLSPSIADLPYDLQAIHGVELIDWHGDTSNADYQRLLQGITAIVGQLPQEKGEAETDHWAEEEAKEKADVEAQRLKEEHHTKAEDRRWKEKQELGEVKTEVSFEKPEPTKVKAHEPKPDAKATIEPESSEPRTWSDALRFGVVAAVIALLVIGIWLYISNSTLPPQDSTLPPQGSTLPPQGSTLPPQDKRFLFTVDGIGPFKTDSAAPVSEVKKIYSDHDVLLREYSAEGVAYSEIVINKDNELILRITQDSGRISDIMAFSPKVIDYNGLRVGDLLETLPLRPKENCFSGADETADKVICTLNFAPNLQYWFEGRGSEGVDSLTPESKVWAIRWINR